MKFSRRTKEFLLVSLFLTASLSALARRDGSPGNVSPPYSDTIDLKAFAIDITAGVQDNYEKARTLLAWLGTHFEWKYTDYEKRSVQQIIARKGGNCFELATVYMALLKELNITYRPIAEVNIQKPDEQRGQRAAQLVKERGNQASVFGKQHNDHRWIEEVEPDEPETATICRSLLFEIALKKKSP